MNHYSILGPGREAGRIISVIFTLTLLSGIGYLIFPDDQLVVETLSVKAVVVPPTDEGSEHSKPSTYKQTKLRLPDGSHAYVMYQYETPNPGDSVNVRVIVYEDGSRKVIPPEVL